jgi:hypothetical protein
MRLVYWVALIAMELVIVASMVPAPNVARISYRKAERLAALDAMHTNPSPATRAAYQEESRLASNHAMRRWLLQEGLPLVGVLVVIDVALAYALRSARPKGADGGKAETLKS